MLPHQKIQVIIEIISKKIIIIKIEAQIINIAYNILRIKIIMKETIYIKVQ